MCKNTQRGIILSHFKQTRVFEVEEERYFSFSFFLLRNEKKKAVVRRR